MAKSLVVVESPAKAKTINKYLGKDFSVKASMGHIRDLPKKGLGVKLDNSFEPSYEVIPGKEKVIKELKAAAKEAEAVFIATDPDREGEAIGWHVAEVLKSRQKKFFRVMFNEITQKAVSEAFHHAGQIDQKLVEAQQARRILDRLVGYKISPLLWHKVRRGTSAGRVQTVALRLVVEREREVRAFVPREYWTIDANLSGHLPPAFDARLQKHAEKTWRSRINNSPRKSFTGWRRPGSSSRMSRKRKKSETPSPPLLPASFSRRPPASLASR